MSREIVVLESARFRLRAVPSNGGAILDLTTRDGSSVLDGPGGADGPPQGLGCFPMAPFCGRLPGGAVHAPGGTPVVLADNLPSGGVAHGVAWRRPWEVIAREHSTLVLRFQHAGDPSVWPWPFECRQCIWIGDDRMGVTLITRNLAPTPMPCASGLHPYVATEAIEPMLVDGRSLALPLAGQGRLATAKVIRLAARPAGWALSSTAESWMIYRPTDRMALCLEPHHGGFDRSPDAYLDPGASQVVTLQIEHVPNGRGGLMSRQRDEAASAQDVGDGPGG